MATNNVKGGRWTLASLVAALAIGIVVGSAVTGKTGQSSSGAGKLVPLWISASDPLPAKEVSFADGFAPVAARVLPAVVNIASSKIVRTQNPLSSLFSDPFFRQFFGNVPSTPKKQIERALGSGVIVSPDGYVMTNNHVISGASEIEVSLADGRNFKATIVGADPMTDVAIVKFDAKDLPVLPLGNSSKLEVGNFVLAFGNPFGLRGTVTMGIVSAKGRANLEIEGENSYEDFIQTDAAINPGNSGGALVDVRGELIGINTAILAGGGGGNEGIGFAIPIDMARQVMDQILKHGKVIRGYLGAWIQPVTPEIAKAFSLPKTEGVLLGDVAPNAPAAKAGLRRGDIILDMDGQPVVDASAFRLKISMLPPETVVKLTIFRNGSESNVAVTLGELSATKEQAQAQKEEESRSRSLQGLTVSNLTPDIAKKLGLPNNAHGVVVTNVDEGSAAAEAGIQQGDVIQEVDRKPVSNVSDFNRLMSSLRNQNVLLLINRGGNTMYVAVTPQ
jgi:serine protease Do